MNDIEFLIALLAAAAVLVRFADALGVPYPIVLVLGGLGIGFLPGVDPIRLDPEVIFLVFLPPLLQSAGFYASPQELRAERLALTGLVLGLALATAAAIGAVAHLAIPQLSWAEALVLGAIVAPTDPVAAVATFERVGVPERVGLLVEGESLLNDASGLVAYKVLLGGVLAGSYELGDVASELTVGVIGGIGIGLAAAWLGGIAIRHLDDPPLAILLTIVTPYVAFTICDEVGASGILAVVSAGLYIGVRSHEIFDADTRLNAISFWRTFVFALNAILFILLGLQFPEILDATGTSHSPGEIIAYGALVSATVIAVRVAWQFLSPLLGVETGIDWRERLIVGWSGMRGAVSLAAALALPLSFDNGAPFTDRDLIIYLTVAVILATLVLQGLTLPLLIRRLGVTGERPWAPEEAIARLAAAQAALDRIEEIDASDEASQVVPDEAVERLRDLYRARFQRCMAALSGEDGAVPAEDPLTAFRRIRLELIEAERAALLTERRQGRAPADVFRRIQRDLDLDEARLRR